MSKKNFYKILDRYLSGTATQDERAFIDSFYTNLQQEQEVTLSTQEKAQIKKRLETKIFKETRPKSNKPYKWIAGIAATFLVLFLYNFQRNWVSEPHSKEIAFVHIKTQEHHKKNVVLPDGTKVVLNSNSSLKFNRDFKLQKTRLVELIGEAFFEVKHDSIHPFIVQSKTLTTKVLGTTFNVKTDSLSTNVALVEGSVELQGVNKEKIKLKPLESARLQKDEDSIKVSTLDRELELAWMSNKFDFQQEPLQRVVKILQRRYNKEIVLANTQLANKRVTGFYENESLETILKSLALAGNLNFKHITTNQILIYEST